MDYNIKSRLNDRLKAGMEEREAAALHDREMAELKPLYDAAKERQYIRNKEYFMPSPKCIKEPNK